MKAKVITPTTSIDELIELSKDGLAFYVKIGEDKFRKVSKNGALKYAQKNAPFLVQKFGSTIYIG